MPYMCGTCGQAESLCQCTRQFYERQKLWNEPSYTQSLPRDFGLLAYEQTHDSAGNRLEYGTESREGVRVENERSGFLYTRMDWREPRAPMFLVYDEASDTPVEAYMGVDTWIKAEIVYPEGWTRVELAHNQFVRIKPNKPHLRLHVKPGWRPGQLLWWVAPYGKGANGWGGVCWYGSAQAICDAAHME